MLERGVTFIFIFYLDVFLEPFLSLITNSHKLFFSFFFFIFLIFPLFLISLFYFFIVRFFILHFLILRPTCGVLVFMSCMVNRNVGDIQYKIVIKNFLKSLWLKWLSWLIYKATNSILFWLWVHLIAILDKPLSVFSRLVKIKFSCVNNLIKVYFTLLSLNHFSFFIELSNGSLDSNFVCLRDKINLVQQDHISKFDLLA